MTEQNELLLLDKKTEEMMNNYLPKEATIFDIAGLFSVFSEPTRLKILSALSISELCVTDISRILGLNQTTVSHQLRMLSGQGLVRSKRQGKIKFYSLASEVVPNVLYEAVEFLSC